MSTQTDQLKQRNRELSILNAIAHALNQSVDLDQALETALEKVAALIDLNTSWIWLMHEETGEPYLAAAQNLPPVLRDNPANWKPWMRCSKTIQIGKGCLKPCAMPWLWRAIIWRMRGALCWICALHRLKIAL